MANVSFPWSQPFEHLVTWSLLGDAVCCLEAMALLEEVHHWGRAQSPVISISRSVILAFEDVSTRLRVPNPCLSLAPMSLYQDGLLPLKP